MERLYNKALKTAISQEGLRLEESVL